MWSAFLRMASSSRLCADRLARTPSNSTEIRIANADGSGDHLLATLPGYLPFPLLRAAWSPDGKTLVAPNLLSRRRDDGC